VFYIFYKALLEKSLTVEGKRQRKATERLSLAETPKEATKTVVAHVNKRKTTNSSEGII
jgi:hypothetical protein